MVSMWFIPQQGSPALHAMVIKWGPSSLSFALLYKFLSAHISDLALSLRPQIPLWEKSGY